ncbi:hypothetical protein MCP1_80043 [Candidatus Terasakiella magnetica]|nr:hypothetical protein MCP1_80043 [Candidatus Terasakiella magnetica]
MPDVPRQIPARLLVAAIQGHEADALLAQWGRAEDEGAARRHFRPQRRRQTMVGRALARQLVADAMGGTIIATAPSGRPLVPDHPELDLSISHGGGWAACALVTGGRIGIDIEVARPDRDYAALAAAFFSTPEIECVAQGGQSAFLALWTLREAWAKAVGGGLSAALGLNGNGLPALIGSGGGIMDSWILEHRPDPRFHLALAWQPGPAVTPPAVAPP